MIEVY